MYKLDLIASSFVGAALWTRSLQTFSKRSHHNTGPSGAGVCRTFHAPAHEGGNMQLCIRGAAGSCMHGQ